MRCWRYGSSAAGRPVRYPAREGQVTRVVAGVVEGRMPAKGAGKHVAAVPAGDHPGLAGILVVHWVRAACRMMPRDYAIDCNPADLQTTGLPSNMCILKGFNTTLAKTTTNVFPFGLWFANADTLVAITDPLTATAPGAGESFRTVETARFAEVRERRA